MKTDLPLARFGLLIVCACCFMTSLDMSIVNVALPVMINSLHAPLSQVIWVINGYMLVYAAFSVPAGRLGDILGQRRLFVGGLVLFTIASVLCGFSQNVFLLIGARLVQGISAACISAPSLVLLTSVVTPERRGSALGIYASMIAMAGIIGPAAGGLIVSTLGTNWIFFVNVPIGILLIIGTLTIVPRVKIERAHSLDVVGVILAAIGLSSIIFAVVEGPTYNWGEIVGPITIMHFLIGGLILLVVFAFWESRQREPFLPLSFFKNWHFASIVTVNTIVAFSALSVSFLATLYLESAIGMNALIAGLTLLPESIAVLIIAPLAGRLSDKFGNIRVLIGGLLCFAFGLGTLIWVCNTSPNWLTMALPLIITGGGLACTMSPVMGEALKGIKPSMMGAASGILSTTRLMGGTIGLAVVSSFLQSRLFVAFNGQIAATVHQAPASQQPAFIAYLHTLMETASTGHTTLSSFLQRLGHQIYTDSFVTALHATFSLIIALLVVGALLTLTARGVGGERKATDEVTTPAVEAESLRQTQSIG